MYALSGLLLSGVETDNSFKKSEGEVQIKWMMFWSSSFETEFRAAVMEFAVMLWDVHHVCPALSKHNAKTFGQETETIFLLYNATGLTVGILFLFYFIFKFKCSFNAADRAVGQQHHSKWPNHILSLSFSNLPIYLWLQLHSLAFPSLISTQMETMEYSDCQPPIPLQFFLWWIGWLLKISSFMSQGGAIMALDILTLLEPIPTWLMNRWNHFWNMVKRCHRHTKCCELEWL